MIPVTQTKLHDPDNGVNGNCWRAAIASILEIGIDDIPHLEDAEYGWVDFHEFLLTQGMVPKFSDDPPEGYVLAVGLSPRGVSHCVVAKDGEFVHDPHPAGGFVLEVKEWIKLEKLPEG